MKLYQAVLLLCLSSSIVFAQRSNDECTNAIQVGVNTITPYSTIDSTTSSQPIGCTTPSDVWFSFAATAGVPVVVSTCSENNGSTTFDSAISYHTSCTSSGAGCYRATCGPTGSGQGATVVITPRDTANIYIKIGGWLTSTPQGTGMLAVMQPDPLVTAPTRYSSYYGGDQVYISWYTGGPSSQNVQIVWSAPSAPNSPSGIIATSAPNTGSYMWTVPVDIPKDTASAYTKIVTVRNLRTGAQSESFGFRVLENYVRWRSLPSTLYPGVEFVAFWTFNGPDNALVNVDLYQSVIADGQDGFIANVATSIPVVSGATGVRMTIPTTAPITPTAGGTQYVMRIRFTANPASVNDPRYYIMVATPSAPLAPINLRVIDNSITSSTAMIYWTAPTVPSGALPINEYYVNITGIPGHHIPGSSNSYQVNNLQGSTQYTATVYAFNGALYSSASNQIQFTTLAGQQSGENFPPPPTGVHCVAFQPNVIIVGYDAVTSPNTGYHIAVNVKDPSVNAPRVSPYITHDPSATFTELARGVEYEFQVYTRSSPTGQRLSFGSQRVTCSTDTSVADAPTGLQLLAVGSTEIQIVWSAPMLNGGAFVSNYRITYQATSDAQPTMIITDTMSTNMLLTNLSPRTEYIITVAAENRMGFSPESKTLFATTTIAHTPPNAGGSSGASAPVEESFYTNITSSGFGTSFFACILAALVIGLVYTVVRMFPRIRARVMGNNPKYGAASTFDEEESFTRSFNRG